MIEGSIGGMSEGVREQGCEGLRGGSTEASVFDKIILKIPSMKPRCCQL